MAKNDVNDMGLDRFGVKALYEAMTASNDAIGRGAPPKKAKKAPAKKAAAKKAPAKKAAK